MEESSKRGVPIVPHETIGKRRPRSSAVPRGTRFGETAPVGSGKTYPPHKINVPRGTTFPGIIKKTVVANPLSGKYSLKKEFTRREYPAIKHVAMISEWKPAQTMSTTVERELRQGHARRAKAISAWPKRLAKPPKPGN